MEPKRAKLTYQLAPPSTKPKDVHGHDEITLQLLQVCQTVYSEARQVFYKKNVFSFTGRFPIPTALAFLQDLPATAVALLSSIELALTEDNNMRGTAEAHFPSTRRSSDCLVLQHAFHYFTNLCKLLSSPAIRLRRLYLTIESLSSYGDSQPESLPECLAWEAEKSSFDRPWTASWIQPLLQVGGLESIRIYWISDRPRVRRMSDTLSTMQQSMLKRAGSEEINQDHNAPGHELDFGILKNSSSNVTTTVVLKPQAEQFEWGDCSCEDRSTGLEHFTSQDPGTSGPFYKCGIATWKEHQTYFTGFKSAYTAYCELGGTCSPWTARRKSSNCAVHFDR